MFYIDWWSTLEGWIQHSWWEASVMYADDWPFTATLSGSPSKRHLMMRLELSWLTRGAFGSVLTKALFCRFFLICTMYS